MQRNEVSLERIRLGVIRTLSREMAVQLDAEVIERRIHDEIVYLFRAEILGQNSKTEVRYPADWWQAFKARWFPRWAQRRCPVREAVIVIHAQRMFPDIAPISSRGRMTYRVQSDAVFYDPPNHD